MKKKVELKLNIPQVIFSPISCHQRYNVILFFFDLTCGVYRKGGVPPPTHPHTKIQ